MSLRLPSRLLGLVVVAVAVPACTNAGPQAGATWTVDAVDRSGVFGTITIERGEIIPLPAGVAAAVPGAARGILVHIRYAPARPSDTGMGRLDWGAAVADEDIGVGGATARVMGLQGDADWPVEPTLGTKLPGSDDPLEGWLVIPLSVEELAQAVTLRYQPYLVDLGNNASDAELVSEVVIHDP